MSTLTTFELNEKIAKRAIEKEEFRAALLSNPKKALENEFGVIIPDNLQIKIHQETKNTLHLIVPELDTLELTDDQLNQVAGGFSSNFDNYCVAYGVPGAWNFPDIFGSK
ncbi:MAG: hypothetical protein APF81_20170 [Desulfosporosinus sp. BRH_c37]|nr:MAG: hypothetical protein APF81_20170 [Desulfosporosinus sp. BRH_c37]